MKKITSCLLILMLLVLTLPLRTFALAALEDTQTYTNLYAAVQGETNATATYKAFAAKAEADGYPVIARLFLATADAEAKHAEDEWAVLVSMGATARPTADTPTVGTTAENLQAAFDGETYEYTEMYPGFVATAVAEGMNENPYNARRIFNLASQAEAVHAGNYADVLANLGDLAYINTKYAVVYRCPVCGEIVTSRSGVCPICGTSGSAFVMYNGTYFNLYAAVQGETNATATYKAFAAKAEADGYPVIARLFLATADAEAKHAEDEWAVLVSMGATARPTADTPTVGTTAENLQAAFDGETYEYTVMYPGFITAADAEGMNTNPYNARRIFNLARQAEEVHAGNYADVLANLGDLAYINTKYAVVYRCPVCGEIVTSRSGVCPICGTSGSAFVMYAETTSIAINAPTQTTVLRVSKYTFTATLNPGAISEGIVWSILPSEFASVNPTTGEVSTQNKTGTVLLTATDITSGLSNSVVLRII